MSIWDKPYRLRWHTITSFADFGRALQDDRSFDIAIGVDHNEHVASRLAERRVDRACLAKWLARCVALYDLGFW